MRILKSLDEEKKFTEIETFDKIEFKWKLGKSDGGAQKSDGQSPFPSPPLLPARPPNSTQQPVWKAVHGWKDIVEPRVEWV